MIALPLPYFRHYSPMAVVRVRLGGDYSMDRGLWKSKATRYLLRSRVRSGSLDGRGKASVCGIFQFFLCISDFSGGVSIKFYIIDLR